MLSIGLKSLKTSLSRKSSFIVTSIHDNHSSTLYIALRPSLCEPVRRTTWLSPSASVSLALWVMIQEVLVKFVEKVVRFDGDLNQVEVTYRLEVQNTSGIQLQMVLEAMEMVGILEYGLAKVADSMIKYVVTTFINRGQPLPFLEESNQESAVLKIVPSPESKVHEFESALKELMFISASDDKDNRLSNFAENVEVHFAFKKKTEILAKARNLLLECYFSVPQEYTRDGSIWKNDETPIESSSHIVDLLFISERVLVSEATKQLMEIIHQTLQVPAEVKEVLNTF